MRIRTLRNKCNLSFDFVAGNELEFYLCITFKKRKRKNNNDSVAQPVEQYTFNVWVLGSNPSGITKIKSTLKSPAITRLAGLFLLTGYKNLHKESKLTLNYLCCCKACFTVSLLGLEMGIFSPDIKSRMPPSSFNQLFTYLGFTKWLW